MQRAGETERPHDQHLPEQHREHQRDAAGMIAEAMQARDQQRNGQHEHVVGVDEDEPAKVVNGIDDQMRQRSCGDRKCRNVHAPLALDHQRIGRNDPDRYQAIQPLWKLDGGLALTANEVP